MTTTLIGGIPIPGALAAYRGLGTGEKIAFALLLHLAPEGAATVLGSMIAARLGICQTRARERIIALSDARLIEITSGGYYQLGYRILPTALAAECREQTKGD